ncbi:MAG TPA: tetratricopeptide repeat protein [Steroidobacteraceae bacterium]|nr:tetratricopeptide repeat protein [Steroidobacteraceae bacterium]
MDEYLNEKEQWERLLASLREQAPWMLAGVAVVAAAFAGWHLWQARAEHRALEAAGLYSQALDAFTRNDLAGGVKIADRVVQEFSGSAYSDQVNLAAARVQTEAQQLDQAAARLAQVLHNTRDPALALVARLRLARVQLAQGKPDEAIKTLDAVPAGAFSARYAEVRGDALLAKGDREGALKQYRDARAGGTGTVDAELLDLKINELAHS